MVESWKSTYRLTIFAIGFAVVVVGLGAYTRLADAGLGCPDWPGCYGFVGVPMSTSAIATAEAAFPDAPVEVGKAWWEMIHRYFAGTLGLLIVAIAISAWRRRRSGIPLKLAFALVALVICQGAFGAWTVTLKLWPQVVTAHLLGGFTTLALLFLLALRLGLGQRFFVPGSLQRHAQIALVLVVLQVALGGWTSSNYAALACHDFPGCQVEQAWPQMDFAKGFDVTQAVGPNYLGGQLDNAARQTIHMTHRLGAVLVLLVVGALAWRLHRSSAHLGGRLAAVLAVQLTLGVTNIVWVLPLWNATLHNLGGAALLLVLVAVNYGAFCSARSRVAVERGPGTVVGSTSPAAA
ncbi:MAG: COX15/CtaA family protein [Pseudomonadota bacterium]